MRTASSPRKHARPQEVYERLRALIIDGRLAPGTRLVETDIASRLGVSRTPVRGALQRLQQEGYVVDSPTLRQTRPTVAPLTSDDAHELFVLVGALEGLAAARAALGTPAERTALATELAEINDAFRSAATASRPDHGRIFELDERFHRCYMQAAGRRVRSLHDTVKPQAERYERLYVSMLTPELHTSVVEHRAIIRAIRAGDAPAAQAAVETNWRNAAERLAAVVTATGERGSW
ncbi:MAG TPA: GntR family transcriptional regulator [Gemmatimonadaceae bacterium]|jgi:DNA-binding GntR family transcriptional regulator|nr:GntR family transcriptional regulator [Gemmatimonadaceae bacterium]